MPIPPPILPTVEPEASTLANALILIVDDVAANLKMLRSLLAQTDYRLSFAASGQQAIERVESAHPDLILLDLMMPGIDGLEVCKQLKQNPRSADIPIIFLTASQDIEHLIEAFKEGAVDYVTKPFRGPELLARINTHLDLTRLRRQAQRQAAQEEILRQVVIGIHASLELTEILNYAIAGIQVLLKADRVFICRHFPDSEWQVVTSSLAASPPRVSFAETTETHYISVDRPDSLDPVDAAWLQQSQTAAELRSPIFLGQHLWGVMLIQYDQPQQWISGEGALVKPIAAQLAIAISQAELYSQLADSVGQLKVLNHELTRLSNLDGLTQIGNRRFFETQYQQEWARSVREQAPIAVILADVDYFKNYNDTYGHLEGDACLRAVAQILAEAPRRSTDIVARYGGEEFVLVLANTHASGAEHVARRIQTLLADLDIPHTSHQTSSRVTISLGIASTIPDLTINPLDLIDQADKALYAAKAKGRNTYAIAPACDESYRQ